MDLDKTEDNDNDKTNTDMDNKSKMIEKCFRGVSNFIVILKCILFTIENIFLKDVTRHF